MLGGGVMEQLHLFPQVRTETQDLLNGYVQAPEILDRIDEFIVPPGLGNKAGSLRLHRPGPAGAGRPRHEPRRARTCGDAGGSGHRSRAAWTRGPCGRARPRPSHDAPRSVDADPWRQTFHIQPPVGLLNDPNGLVEHGGTYHLCYQWHPFEPAARLKFWAHLTSTDLVHWVEQPPALAPSNP